MQNYKHSKTPPLQPHYEPFDICGECKRNRQTAGALLAFALICFLLVSCGEKRAIFTSADRRTADSIVSATHGIDCSPGYKSGWNARATGSGALWL